MKIFQQTECSFTEQVWEIDFFIPLTGAYGLPLAPSQVMSAYMNNKKRRKIQRRQEPYEPEHQL